MSHARSSGSQGYENVFGRVGDHEGVKFYKDDEGFWEFSHEHYLDSGDEVVRKWVCSCYLRRLMW